MTGFPNRFSPREGLPARRRRQGSRPFGINAVAPGRAALPQGARAGGVAWCSPHLFRTAESARP